MNRVGHENIQNHENALLEYAQRQLLEIEGLKVYGEKAKELGLFPSIWKEWDCF
jgi:cysteine desulfurase/selenocysteine lyase